MTEIHLSSITLVSNKLHWILNGNKFSINYNFETNIKFIEVFKLIPIIYALCLLSINNKTPKLYTDFKLSKQELLFIKEYYNYQYIFNSNQLLIKGVVPKQSRKIIINDDVIKTSDMNITKTLESMSINGIDETIPKKAVSSWSGGKDSLLTIKLLEECGIEVIPVVTKWNTIAFNRGANIFLDNHEIVPLKIASTALNSRIKHTAIDVLNSINYIAKDKYNTTGVYNSSKHELPNILYHSAYMNTQVINNILYALHNGLQYAFVGDEAGVNETEMIYEGIFIANIGQSYRSKKLINAYINSVLEYPANIFSVLYPIDSPFEIKLLLERYKTLEFSSCLTMINKWCNVCPKCISTAMMLCSLGYNPSIIGINIDKMLKYYKKEIGTSYTTPSANLVYWMVKHTLHHKKLSKITNSYLSEYPDDENYNPLKILKQKYYTIPKCIRKQIVSIYKHIEN